MIWDTVSLRGPRTPLNWAEISESSFCPASSSSPTSGHVRGWASLPSTVKLKEPPRQKKFRHRVWPIQFMNCYWQRSYLCLVVKHYKWTMGTINFSESKLLESLVYISLSTDFPADSELTPGEILLTRITWRNYESPFIRGSSALCLFHKCLL